MAFLSSLPEEAIGPIVWKLHPEAYSAWPDLAGTVMASESELTLGEKELVGAYGSALRGCRHCYTAHFPVATAFGIDEQLFADIMRDPSDAPTDARTKALLIFVKKHTENPKGLSRTDIEAARKCGWSERALSDAVLINGLFSFMNILMIGHGADDVDVSGIGPLHAVIRGRGKYGHGERTGRENVLLVMWESIRRFGVVSTLRALRRGRQLGLVGGRTARHDKGGQR
ncbi:carboxymuconolactone decarboxylase family protein [Sinimarinibacterium flocculans]|uniref:carboxymuconolactone decarboxylase family protein n=1 Tax=Sinimarinibacterium flocculans TaxID=985250 RepID=UPI003515425C